MKSSHALEAYVSTTLFVLLWSSGAIFAKWGLEHSSAFAFLLLRFAIAFGALLLIGIYRKRLLPDSGTGPRVAATGLIMIGGYSVCYLMALDNGITPGVLATLLGVQPILTLLVLERRFPVSRLLGLGLALTGLVLVVLQSVLKADFSVVGIAFALGAVLCVTSGAIAQKSIQQEPAQVLPLQYAISLLLCVAVAPTQPLHFEHSISFLIPVLWLGLVISVIAQLLLYRLIRAGNLVNVTSLFYLVPVVTAVMDYLFLGNLLSGLSLLGMLAILLGLALVFRQPKTH